MNWDDAKYFLTVSRRKSFVAAAAELKVTHTTVARRITALEEDLQAQLFYRSEKGCVLTAAGELMVPHAENIESTIIQIKESVTGFDHQVSGSVRLGAPDGFGHSYMAYKLGVLQKLHKRLEVELIAVPMYYSLTRREIDVLITVKKPVTGSAITRKLTRYKLGLYGTESYLKGTPPVTTIEDLKEHTLIGYIDDLLFDDDLRFFEEISASLDLQLRSSTVVAQMNAVASGAGIGVIPYFMACRMDNLVQILPEVSFERGYWLQVNPDTRQLARVRSTIDFLVDQVQKDRKLFLSPTGC